MLIKQSLKKFTSLFLIGTSGSLYFLVMTIFSSPRNALTITITVTVTVRGNGNGQCHDHGNGNGNGHGNRNS